MPDHASPSQAALEGDRAAPVAARPYGLVGLGVSTLLILLSTIVLCALAAGLAFAAASAALGWQEVAQRFTALDGADARSGGLGNDTLQRAGVVLSLGLYVAFSLSVLGAARLRGGARGWRSLVAWRAWNPVRDSRLVWVLLVVTLGYSLGANIALEWLYPASKDWVQLPGGRSWSALFVLLAVVAAPVAEELFFRGWLYTGLRARVGATVTILVTAVLFALAHWEKTHLYALAVFPVGLALGLIRERTRSIGATMTFHAGYNGFASLLLLFGP